MTYSNYYNKFRHRHQHTQECNVTYLILCVGDPRIDYAFLAHRNNQRSPPYQWLKAEVNAIYNKWGDE